MAGRVVHFEIPFDDKARAKAFYTKIFGWQAEEMPGFADYIGVATGPMGEQGPTAPGYIGGGMTPREGANAATVVVLECDDIDATLAEIAASGGEALSEKIPVGDMGFSAYFRDTEGNVVGLWENAAPA